MHLLNSSSGVIDGNAEAIDLAQSPAPIVVLSAADSELALLARAQDHVGLKLRLANLLLLQHPMSVDLYVDRTLSHARLIILRLLGGASYWSYGLEQLEELARNKGIHLVILPGDSSPDPELTRRSTLAGHVCERLRQYLASGGLENAKRFLAYCKHITEGTEAPSPAEPVAKHGIYRESTLSNCPTACLVFYSSLLDGAQTGPIDALVTTLESLGIGTRALHVASMRDRASLAFLSRELTDHPPDIILNTTSFSVSSAGVTDPLRACDCPVLQVVLSGGAEQTWRMNTQGLSARDLAMNVVLPELDGRIISRAVSFKAESRWHEATQCRIITYAAVPDRIEFVATLAANWIKLRRTPASERKIAVVLANYPNKSGRIANGVGFDTPASTLNIMKSLKSTGYAVTDIPNTGNDLIRSLQDGPTNEKQSIRHKPASVTLRLAHYLQYFLSLPEAIREQINARWGSPEQDMFFSGDHFNIPALTFGHVAVAIQPARGYNIDPKSTYHDPALPPPHGYLAFYVWLTQAFGAHAVIHNGKHGNLEWLPGKATALSSECFPEIVLGPIPQLYPFIINDPGEGTQAKRRTAAVIISHLTPPLTRAETYGPYRQLEALMDEYYLASGLDNRRSDALRKTILDLATMSRLDLDAGFMNDPDRDLQKLDALLCDLKEAQIRNGLHILGESPHGQLEAELLVALARLPRQSDEMGEQSLIRALAKDFGFLGFDPLSCDMTEPWRLHKPETLIQQTTDAWRNASDTIERLELFALKLVNGKPLPSGFDQTRLVLETIRLDIQPRLRACGSSEIKSLLAGLDGRFVDPGPSGAPTRGRSDILPTGKNFYSLDNRTLPTPTAWSLGKKSAEQLLVRHLQDTGQYPKAIGLSAWGTSNMRTGGDDIAQALALIGVKPVWDPTSWRVTGFEVLPLAVLGRPRVDVTLRISGFFRDAFPAQIELLDKAIRSVASLDEDEEENPLAARTSSEARALAQTGIALEEARRIAGTRIFGSKPGAYGAGLQALIDERIWSNRKDLAAAYITWGAYAYGAASGEFDEKAFRARLARIDAVVHNQDNREHDLLDSDDYYQFEGGMTVAVEQTSGHRPRTYHNDHSRPERPVIRTLEEEVGRVMRSRVVNPKWISGIKRHGYKGAFEIAATIDYMFAFAATTGSVLSHHFDLAYDAFIMDLGTRMFIAENNPAAFREIASRLAEAIERGLWVPRANSVHEVLEDLKK